MVTESVDFNTNSCNNFAITTFCRRGCVILETAAANRVLRGVFPGDRKTAKHRLCRLVVHNNSEFILLLSMCKLKHNMKYFKELKAALVYGFSVAGEFCCTCEFWMCTKSPTCYTEIIPVSKLGKNCAVIVLHLGVECRFNVNSLNLQTMGY